MYEAYDPRSKLAPQAAGAAPVIAGFAAAEYVKFHELPAAEVSALARTWYGRGQNMVVSYSECQPGAEFVRSAQLDEYMLVLPEAGAGAVIEAGAERVEVPGFTLAIVPPGASRVTMRQPGLLIRVISTRNADVAAQCSNASAYAHQHPNIPSFQEWPAPPGGYRIRHYSLDVPAKPGRFGRIFRCTTLMVNILDPRLGLAVPKAVGNAVTRKGSTRTVRRNGDIPDRNNIAVGRPGHGSHRFLLP